MIQNYIGGRWTEASGDETLDGTNPATGEALARIPLSSSTDLDAAVAAARQALPIWREVSVPDRARILFELRHALSERRDEHAALGDHRDGQDDRRRSRRGGAHDRDGRVRVCRAHDHAGRGLENVSRNVDCETIRQPVGVCAAIVPFNPAMVPFWFLPFAIACGDTFILKPSEQVPLTQQMTFEVLDGLGLPPSVVNLVNGSKEVVEGILDHPGINAVSFVGSAPVARIVYETPTVPMRSSSSPARRP